MAKALPARLFALSLFVLLLPACGDEQRCEPGEEIECSCEDGEQGTRYCLSNRRFDPCYCGGDLDFTPSSRSRDAGSVPDEKEDAGTFDAGRMDAGRIDAGRDAGFDAGFDAGPIDGVLLAASSERLIEMFVLDDDIVLVLPQRVARISLADGGEQAHWDAPRLLTGAVFDGARLVALDSAKLTTLELATLSEQASSNLVEPCTSAALVKGGPLTCMTASNELVALEPADGGRSGSVRALRAGKLLAVPGTRRVVTIDSNSSLSPLTYEAPLDGGIAAVSDAGTTLLPSGFNLTLPWSFDGEPAQNLINRLGALYRISDTCGPPSDPCFVRTGTLGVLLTQEAFLGLSNADNQLYGLIDTNTSNFASPGRCDSVTCRLVRVDVPARVVRAELKIRRPLREVIAMHALPARKALVVALAPPGRDAFSGLDGGYQVVRLDLPESP